MAALLRGAETANGEAGYCAHCARAMPEGPDACLGLLPGVEWACCGHGWIVRPQVSVSGEILSGKAAIEFFESRGVGPSPVESYEVVKAEQHEGAVRLKLLVEYETDRVLEVRWENESGAAPVWRVGGREVVLARGGGAIDVGDLGLVDPDCETV